MPEWSSDDVDVNGVRIHYYRTGGDKPPLVLSHGATDDGLCWTRVVRVLESDYDVIMPDARGHGLSDAPESGYTSADHAGDLAGLIRSLGLGRPAVGGHSMGAMTTLRLIADYPDIASCAILEDPGFRLGEPQAPAPGKEEPRSAMLRIIVEAQEHGLEATMARGRTQSPNWGEAEFQPWAQSKLRVRRAFMNDMGSRRWNEEWRELLPRVTCPVLLITADPERGAIVTPEGADEASRLAPTLQVVRLRGAGHNIRREQFDGFIDAVRPFLAAHVAPTSARTA